MRQWPQRHKLLRDCSSRLCTVLLG
jgi:hypothetical protein